MDGVSDNSPNHFRFKPCIEPGYFLRLYLGWSPANFFKWAIHGLFFFIFVFSIQLSANKCSI